MRVALRVVVVRVVVVPMLVASMLVAAGGAAHATGITGHITLYPQGSSVSPGPISGNGSGEPWYEAAVGTAAHLRRMSVSSGLTTADAPTGLSGSTLPSGTVASSSDGGAYWTPADPHGALTGGGWVGYGTASSGNVTKADSEDLTTVATLGSAVF